MKKLTILGILFLSGVSLSCSQNDGMTQEEEAQNLSIMFSEISLLAVSVTCEDASEWTYTSYGEKACGGPVGFIAYATTIDTCIKARIQSRSTNHRNDCHIHHRSTRF